MDFKKADFTAIVSDMHLCESQQVDPKFPLWKKYKTKEFFFDDVFQNFLTHLEKKSDKKPVELVLNGDIFDFDSVMTLPHHPTFRLSWVEKIRGMHPRPERSKFKMQTIIDEHKLWFKALSQFIERGNRAIFVMGNHDLELHFPEVQSTIRRGLSLSEEAQNRLRFVEWFYISNKDTLIEHGNQYDPYCMCENPIQPFSRGYNYKTIPLPFGNLACRFILNGMGFFNPHVESNYIMSLREYIRFFLKYMVKAQPTLMIDWLMGAFLTLWFSIKDRWLVPVKTPLQLEQRVNEIAERSNAEPRMVRELQGLFTTPASTNPILMARELWLDRALLILLSFVGTFLVMSLIKTVLDISFFWMFLPLLALLPFFLFYSRSVTSHVSSFKEPNEEILSLASSITGVQRIVYGHTHIVRHEMIGAVEHLNSGCWSPAFKDVECTQAADQKTFVWLEPDLKGQRKAQLLTFAEGQVREALPHGLR